MSLCYDMLKGVNLRVLSLQTHEIPILISHLQGPYAWQGGKQLIIGHNECSGCKPLFLLPSLWYKIL